MASWGGSWRDGQIARPEGYFPRDSATPNAAAAVDTNLRANADANTNAHTNSVYANANATVDPVDYNYFLTGIESPDIQDLITNNNNNNYHNNTNIPSYYPFPPLPTPPTNDSLLATIPSHAYSDLNTTTNSPLFHYGGILHSGPVAPSHEPPLPTPPTQRSAQAPAPRYQDHFSSIGLARHQLCRPGGRLPHEPSRTCQVISPAALQRNVQGNIQSNSHNNPYPAALPSFATPLPTLPRAPMNNARPRPNPPTSQAWARSPAGDDAFIASFAQDFSSPSLPPLSGLPSPSLPSPSGRSKRAAAGQGMPPSQRRAPNSRGAVGLTKEEHELEAPRSGVDLSIPLATMPVTSRRSAVRKRRSSTVTSPSRPNKARRKEQIPGSDGRSYPFGDDDPFGLGEHSGSETIDLCNATEVPAEYMAPKVDNRVKIGKFQCVICMDDTTALTVTHCGHLFCSECLHSSLHIDSMKRTCPVCRSKVDLRDKKGKTVKSYYHLELKVMTATKKGKRPADT
ncbi:hypothetical protein GGS24DRAFT_328022 [Hypoxylon argillaceum]|nr:hypothetical protein GGS24DRAFT_328022 [Hypoxylon argillaceum]